jgi:two-component system, OmpR family, response regulator
MRLLIAEDDPDLSRQMKTFLMDAGYAVDVSLDGEDAQFLGETESYDAIILDLGLPIIDGLSILRKWREKDISTPVLILTARDGWSEKVAGLDAGADDYVAKPFQIEEVMARVRALIRRAAGQSSSELTIGSLVLNSVSSKVTVDGQPIKLTAQEYKLLSYMMHHPNKVISRTELTEHIYDQDFDRDSNTIEVFVTRIRKKIGIDIIKTIRGLGYQLAAE